MWGWKNISCADILIKIHGKLKNFETMYWYEIEKNNMNGLLYRFLEEYKLYCQTKLGSDSTFDEITSIN